MKKILLILTLLISSIVHSEEFDKNYMLGAGDKIKIQVFGENDLTIEVLLSDNGTIDYPYLGKVQISGLTLNDVTLKITEGLAGDYLINPKVMVSVIEYRDIYINGEVQKPGGYPYQLGLTIEKAVAMAGGFTLRAEKETFTLKKEDSKNTTKVNLQQSIEPGDIIIVETTFF